MDEESLAELEFLANWLSKLKKRTGEEAFSTILNLLKFENIVQPVDQDWFKRVTEEIKIFNLFKKTIYGDLLPHFENLRASKDNNQVFYVDFIESSDKKSKKCIILLPKLYPILPPNSLRALDGSLEVFTSHTDPTRCLGEILKRYWDKAGRMGIAHWLIFVEVFLGLVKKPLKIA
ncbi:MAG: hypothetical protein ACTSX9_01280 [Candidatus Njordarchaeales archaeon]